MNNPLLKNIKEGDIVLMEIQSSERNSFKEICKLSNLNFQPADKEFNFDWLEFEGEILYTNFRLHKSMLDKPMGNCLSITEIIPIDLVETYVRINDMWRANNFLMSDQELEYKQSKITI